MMKNATKCESNALKSFRMQAALRIDMDDPSVLVMMRQEGFEGVGIYLAVLQHLSERGGEAPLGDVGEIARYGNVSALSVLRVIATYGAFDVDDRGYFRRKERNEGQAVTPEEHDDDEDPLPCEGDPDIDPQLIDFD